MSEVSLVRSFEIESFHNTITMSAWERTRHIPWSRMQQGGEDSVEKHRERVFKELKREALLEQQQTQMNDANINTDADADTDNNSSIMMTSSSLSIPNDNINNNNNNNNNNIKNDIDTYNRPKNILGLHGQPFVTGDCFKQTLFGMTLGSITGACFGFMDGMRQAGESPILKKASNSAKGTFIFQGTTRSGLLFGGFFGGFHLLRYGIRVLGDPGEYPEIAMAGTVSLGAMFAKPTTRASMPYATMLVLMDGFNTYMNEH